MTAPRQIIDKVETFPISIRYTTPLKWGDGRPEYSADYVLLKITTRDGLVGVAEGTVKIVWTGTTLKTLTTVFEEIFAPLLIGADIDDEAAFARLWRVREHSLAKAMIDVALWDIRAQLAGKSLYAMWGGVRDVALSWCVTRNAPAAMASEAERYCRDYGFRALKVKGGQGFDVDREALDGIRSAVGGDVLVYVDCNGAYPVAETPRYVDMLAARGVVMAEDPCRLQPDQAFRDLKKACALPLLVDGSCRSFEAAKQFVAHDATAFNLKLQKARGFTENWEIARYVMARGGEVNLGMFGETSLGSEAALHLAAALPARSAPAEVSLFLLLPQEYVREPLVVKNGATRLSDTPGMAHRVDWMAVERLRA